MPETSQPITSVEPVSVQNDYRTVTITGMELRFYRAAVAGEIDMFMGMSDQIESMLTPNKNTILHIHLTCYKISEAFVNEILYMCPALLTKVNAKDETILHVAARYGHIGIVKIIIECVNKAIPSEDGTKETLIKATNDKKDTALHEAVRYNHKKVVELLINEDPDYSYFANSDEESPLYIATERGYEKVMHTILEKSNPPINYRGPNGRTALHAATLRFGKLTRKKETLQELVSKIPLAIKEADENGWVPLHLAAIDGRCGDDLMEVLLKQDRNTAYMRDNKGRTALHFAAYCGNGLAMSRIIEYCPDCSELVDHKGCNALHYTTSLEGYKHSRRSKAAEVILKEQQLRNMQNEKDNDGNTPLHLLARYASIWTKYHSHPLLKENTKVDTMAFNKNNQTAFDVAYDIVPFSQCENFFLWQLQRKVGPWFGGRVINEDVKQMKIKKKICDSEFKKQIQEEDYFTKRRSKVRQTLLVVATLIATITFAAGFTMPGGTIQDGENNKGSPILIHNAAFKAFVITNSLSFVFSSSAVFLQIFSSFVEGDEDTFTMDQGTFLAALLLTMLGMVFMIIAFGTGTYAILGPTIALAVVTLLIALSFFFTFVFLFYLNHKEETKPHVSYPGGSFLEGEDMQLLDSV